jgi:hypothetical protein
MRRSLGNWRPDIGAVGDEGYWDAGMAGAREILIIGKPDLNLFSGFIGALPCLDNWPQFGKSLGSIGVRTPPDGIQPR